MNELTTKWADTYKNIPNGQPAGIDIFVNTNDPNGLRAVDDLTVTTVVNHAIITGIPPSCRKDVQPPSSISGTNTLSCRLGKTDLGTAIRYRIGIKAVGYHGQKIIATSKIRSISAATTPVPIADSGAILVIADDSGPAQLSLSAAVNGANGDGQPAQVRPVFGIAQTIGSEPLTGPVSFELELTPRADSASVIESVESVAGCRPLPSGGLTKIAAISGDPKCRIEKIAIGRYRVTMTPQLTQNVAKRLPTIPERLYLGGLQLTITLKAGYFKGKPSFGFTMTVPPTTVKATTISARNVSEPDDFPENEQSVVVVKVGGFSAGWHYGDSPKINVLSLQALSSDPLGGTWSGVGQAATGTTILGVRTDDRLLEIGQSLDIEDTHIMSCLKWDRALAQLADTETGFIRKLTNGSIYTHEFLIGQQDIATGTCSSGTWKAHDAVTAADLPKISAVRSFVHKTQYRGEQERVATRPRFKILSANPGTKVLISGAARRPDGSWMTADSHLSEGAIPVLGQIVTGLQDLIWVAKGEIGITVKPAKSLVKNGEENRVTLTSHFGSTVPNVQTKADLTVKIPKSVMVAPGSWTISPSAITNEPDGSTSATWKQLDFKAGQTKSIAFTAVVPSGNNRVEVSAESVQDAFIPGQTYGLRSLATASYDIDYHPITQITKTVSSHEFAVDSMNEWQISLVNRDNSAQETWDLIDILPYNGDDRGSNFHGSYRIVSVTAPATATVYYTEHDPKYLKFGIHSSNGGFGTIAGNTVGWTKNKPTRVTGIRVIGKNLAAAATATVKINWITDHAVKGDVYNNIATANAATTMLKMVMSRSASTAAEGSRLQVDKHRDSVSPITAGATVEWTVTAKNGGTQRAHHVTVTDSLDDRFDPKSFTWLPTAEQTVNGNVWLVGNLEPGQIVKIGVKANIRKAVDVLRPLTNQVIISNPNNLREDGPCIANVDVHGDTDQCDVVTVVGLPPVPTPTPTPTPTPPPTPKPTPSKPSTPKDGDDEIRIDSGLGTPTWIWLSGATLTASLGLALAFWPNRRG